MTTTLPHCGVSTSIAAAESMTPHARSMLERVYALVLSQGARGCTACEVEHVMGISGDTIRPRLVRLRDTGRIINSGAKRLTASGREAFVYIAVPPTTPPTSGTQENQSHVQELP